MRTLLLAAAAAAMLPLAPAVASSLASPLDQPSAVAVHFGDLDLARTRDAAVALDRISLAALDACGAPRESLPDYRWAVRRSNCYRTGVAGAVDQLGAPEVIRLYNNRNAVSLAPTFGR